MKSFIRIATICAALFVAESSALSSLGSTLSAFESKPGYVRPLATTIGTLFNSGWINSARVGNGYGWSFALDIPVAYIGTDDQTYDFTYDTHCASLRADNFNCPESKDIGVLKDVPTIFGGNTTREFYVYRSSFYVDGNGTYIESIDSIPGGTADDGEKTIRKWVNIPFIIPEGSFSYWHTRGTLRGIYVPKISDFGGMYLIGLGLQHDFTRFLPPQVSAKGFNTSVMANIAAWRIGYEPSGDVVGTMAIKGNTSFSGLVVGWRWKKLEIFSELGYETAGFSSSGSLIDYSVATTDSSRYINPDVSVSGRNNFRASINFALHLDGSWQPVVGQSLGAQLGSTVNIIQFGKEGEE